MREIKFRAWNPYQGSIRDTFTVYQLAVGEVSIPSQCFDFLMQSSGMLDVSGREIFEGDIVNVSITNGPGSSNFNAPVVFHGGSFCYEKHYPWNSKPSYKQLVSESKWHDMNASGTHKHYYRVVGNIYENPELIEKGD